LQDFFVFRISSRDQVRHLKEPPSSTLEREPLACRARAAPRSALNQTEYLALLGALGLLAGLALASAGEEAG
jgi:hypothetical protein